MMAHSELRRQTNSNRWTSVNLFLFFCIFKQIARFQGISQNQLVRIDLLSGPAAERWRSDLDGGSSFFIETIHGVRYCRAQVFRQKELFFPEVYALSSRGISILYNPCHGGAVAR